MRYRMASYVNGAENRTRSDRAVPPFRSIKLPLGDMEVTETTDTKFSDFSLIFRHRTPRCSDDKRDLCNRRIFVVESERAPR